MITSFAYNCPLAGILERDQSIQQTSNRSNTILILTNLSRHLHDVNNSKTQIIIRHNRRLSASSQFMHKPVKENRSLYATSQKHNNI